MFSKVVTLFVLLSTLLLSANAFWWSPAAPTTTTEAPTVLKQIPLTYFRTYTYQPLTANPFVFPFFGQGGYAPPPPAAQAPMLTGPRYGQHYANAYPGEQHRMLKDTPTSTAPPPPPPPPTTTTTTTPAPTTTPSTTTTTTTTTTTPPPPPPSTHSPAPAPVESAAAPFYGSEYPTFNRRIYTNGYSPSSNYFRPHYPYPNYAPYGAAAAAATVSPSSYDGTRRSNIQFVPCMCPVSVAAGVGHGLAGLPNAGDQFNSGYMLQSRSTADDDDDDADAVDADLSRATDTAAMRDGDSVGVIDSKHSNKVAVEPELEASLAKGLAGIASAAVQTEAEASQLTNKIDTDLHEQPDDDRLALSEQV